MKRWLASLLAVISLLAFVGDATIAHAAGPITLNGNFNDWAGQPWIADPPSDADEEDEGEITKFWWAVGTQGRGNGTPFVFWRIDREPDDEAITYRIRIDTNNNGQFHNGNDRIIIISYRPLTSGSDVDITVKRAGSGQTVYTSNNNNWGSSKSAGGASLEIGVSHSNLGIAVNQTIRFYAESWEVDDDEEELIDRVPNSGNIQITAASVLGLPLLLGLAGISAVVVWYVRGRRAWKRS